MLSPKLENQTKNQTQNEDTVQLQTRAFKEFYTKFHVAKRAKLIEHINSVNGEPHYYELIPKYSPALTNMTTGVSLLLKKYLQSSIKKTKESERHDQALMDTIAMVDDLAGIHKRLITLI